LLSVSYIEVQHSVALTVFSFLVLLRYVRLYGVGTQLLHLVQWTGFGWCADKLCPV